MERKILFPTSTKQQQDLYTDVRN